MATCHYWGCPATRCLRIRLPETEAGYEVTLTGNQGSGILNSLVQADGLAVIPEEADHLPAGTEVEVILLAPHSIQQFQYPGGGVVVNCERERRVTYAVSEY